jgi:hypothetical protein
MWEHQGAGGEVKFPNWLLILGFLCVGILIAMNVSSSGKRTAAHALAAIDYHNKAVAINNRAGGPNASILLAQGGKPISVNSPSDADWTAIIRDDRAALREAQQANISDMNRDCPGFGDHFRNEFIQGLTLFLNNCDHSNTALQCLHGQALIGQFGDWYEANSDCIRNGKS